MCWYRDKVHVGLSSMSVTFTKRKSLEKIEFHFNPLKIGIWKSKITMGAVGPILLKVILKPENF